MPTNLDSDERVDLVLEKLHDNSLVSINGKMLETIANNARPTRLTITKHLQKRNELQIDIPWTSSEPENQPTGFMREVRLLSKLRHPCITTVMGAVKLTNESMMVMECKF